MRFRGFREYSRLFAPIAKENVFFVHLAVLSHIFLCLFSFLCHLIAIAINILTHFCFLYNARDAVLLNIRLQ